jgi:hypothetical protein
MEARSAGVTTEAPRRVGAQGRLGAVEGLVVVGIGFAADVEGDAGFGEQIALVGGVDEDAGAVAGAVLKNDLAEVGTGP